MKRERNSGRYRQSEAAGLSREALEIAKASLGPDHPHTKLVEANLDDLLATRSTD